MRGEEGVARRGLKEMKQRGAERTEERRKKIDREANLKPLRRPPTPSPSAFKNPKQALIAFWDKRVGVAMVSN